MADLRITCVIKSGKDLPSITHLGGPDGKYSLAELIRCIETGLHSFYTHVNGTRANVFVVKGPTGKYVRTGHDNVLPDNLLSLPPCP